MDLGKEDRERADLARTLDELGRLEADERRASEELTGAPGTLRVERVLEEVWAGPGRGRQRSPWPRLLGALAVAAAVLAFFLLLQDKAPKVDEPSGEHLNEGGFGIKDPGPLQGQWPDRVEWNGPTGLNYFLRIVEEVDGAEVRDLVSKRGILALELRLSTEETRTWPDKIKLVLTARNKDGSRLPAQVVYWVLQR